MPEPAMRPTLLVTACLLGLTAPAGARPVDYLRQVKPVLKEHCFSCHGGLAQKGRLRLDTRAAILRGGRKGPAVVAGKPEKSRLVARVCAVDESERMPPDGPALTAAQVATLKRWISEGARGPAKEAPEPDPRDHWAFRPPVRPPPPDAGRDTAVNPIDRFVAAAQRRHGTPPVAEAPPEVLLRRVYLDLVGLPPTPEEVAAFLADRRPGAYERVVERLLARPQHGERWARHWMDVWRYSDWYGRRHVPDVWNSAPQVWRWRDWVVSSLNADRGYDRMVREMLAADEVAPGDEEAVVATGYLVRNWYALNPNQWLRDNVEHTAKAFLGLTVHCAHCHDHKYDPISQEEYFRFRAFFEPIQVRQDRVRGEADPGPFQKYSYLVLRKVVRLGSVSAFDEDLSAKTYMYHLGDERERMKRPPVAPGAPAFLGGARLKIEPVELPPEVAYPGLRRWAQEDAIAAAEKAVAAARAPGPLAGVRLRAAQAELASARARVAADDARYRTKRDGERLAREASRAERIARAARAAARLAELRAGKPAAAQLQAAEAELVKARQVAKGDSAAYTPFGPVYPARSTGRRKALALWLTSERNPLTARVAVNHIWRWHFGQPLVETVADFGRNGKRPSHPELLDWLAVELVESGWSMKHVHRLIVTSATYRQHSAAGERADNLKRDPENRWLWRYPRRRAEAEVIRDSMLHVAGSLDARMGGEPVENSVAETAFLRRSLYFSYYPEGGGHAKLLELFDAPDPCDCYRREASVLPQQALALTNGPLVASLARGLAGRLLKEADATRGADARRTDLVRLAFERVLSRRPSARETAVCSAFLKRQATAADELPAAAAEGLVRALFNHEDFLNIR
jgi:hypothetical protein